MMPLIALVGRPNVGKSTLFNRLTRSRQALVDATPGMTRDRQYGTAQWQGRLFRVVDTGGFEADDGENMAALIREQALVAIQEADGVIMVADATNGLMPDDREIAQLLRQAGKPVAVAVNKADFKGAIGEVMLFHELGLSPVVAVSGLHGMGVPELLESLVEPLLHAAEEHPPTVAEEGIRVAVIGCPNVGKSSLINRILGENRLVASDTAGTTRDSLDVPLDGPGGQRYTLVDTAGIRRKGRVSLRVEKFSIIAALKAMDRADVAVLVLDPTRGIGDQDRRVANYALEKGCGLVIAVNKWDTVESRKTAVKPFLESIQLAFPRFSHAPVLFVSAHSGRQVERLLPMVKRVYEAQTIDIGTGPLNRWLREAVTVTPPPRAAGRPVKIRYATQSGVCPPTFLLFCNRPDQVGESYQRYLENRLREAFPLRGAPLRLQLRTGGDNPFAPAPGKRPPAPNRRGGGRGTRGGGCRAGVCKV